MQKSLILLLLFMQKSLITPAFPEWKGGFVDCLYVKLNCRSDVAPFKCGAMFLTRQKYQTILHETDKSVSNYFVRIQKFGGDTMIDPVTAAKAAKAAVAVLTDEEARKKLLIIVIAPVAGLILLISLFFYILTMPLQFLTNFFFGSNLDNVHNVRAESGYDQYIDPTSADYLASDGVDYTNVRFTDGATEVVYFNQLDSRWKNLPYGPSDTIGSSGCGPTSLAIAVSSLTSQTIDPVQMCNWAYQNGYLCVGSGSYHSLIPEGAKHFGLTVDYAKPSEPQKIVDALASGKLVIGIFGPGHFTTSGHFMVLRGVTADGKILIADPASKNRSEQEWDLQIILDEARKNSAANGPFWILSNSSGQNAPNTPPVI